MKQRPRIYYSASQKELMWKRWKEGWTLHQIAHLFNRFHSSVHRILAETGGIRPPDRRRSSLALTLAEREEISRALVIGHSIRAIAARIGRAPSTVSREIERKVGNLAIERTRPTVRLGIGHIALSAASWRRTEAWRASWPTNFACCGHQSRSPDGSSILTRVTRATTCHTRPSTAAYSFKRVEP